MFGLSVGKLLHNELFTGSEIKCAGKDFQLCQLKETTNYYINASD